MLVNVETDSVPGDDEFLYRATPEDIERHLNK